MVNVENSSLQVTVTAQVGWLGLRVGSHLVLFYIYHINWVNSGNDFCHMTGLTAPQTLSRVIIIINIHLYSVHTSPFNPTHSIKSQFQYLLIT